MHDHIDAVVRQTEQVMRFDDLERLVRQCRAVDGDLTAHAPRGMLQCIRERGVLDRICIPIAKGPTRCCEDHAPHLHVATACDALQHCAVLAVDGYYLALTARARGLDEMPTHYQALLVRERNAFAGL